MERRTKKNETLNVLCLSPANAILSKLNTSIMSTADGGSTCAHGDSKEAACCCVGYTKMRHGDSRSLMLFQSSFGSRTPRGGKKDNPQL
ncbi:hypothetical protein KQX54_012298 [Cotesia glomerata]|uniref:Uncharacterized protein n=1 Tax=Cotesia glomerata TaxID=32391 RepID=A0AAV7J6S2_COTGL|nr:hypothetical protein KQX54_012298 [Cotesia glomerata]